jgi:hypothetical protein
VSALTGELAEYETVRQWVRGLAEQWGEAPDMAPRYAALQTFVELAAADPDKMIADCTREVESGKRIRVKARREYSEKIEAFQQSVEGTAREQARAANYVRSFFIHNGIFMQSGVTG